MALQVHFLHFGLAIVCRTAYLTQNVRSLGMEYWQKNLALPRCLMSMFCFCKSFLRIFFAEWVIQGLFSIEMAMNVLYEHVVSFLVRIVENQPRTHVQAATGLLGCLQDNKCLLSCKTVSFGNGIMDLIKLLLALRLNVNLVNNNVSL